MKTTQKESLPDGLSRVLREWRSDAPLPPGFQASVWHRIDLKNVEHDRGSLFEIILIWLNHFVARPQMAAALIAVLVMVGVTAGWTQGVHENAKVQNQLAQRYIATLDPYQPSRQLP